MQSLFPSPYLVPMYILIFTKLAEMLIFAFLSHSPLVRLIEEKGTGRGGPSDGCLSLPAVWGQPKLCAGSLS